MGTSLLQTDGYKFSMAEAGWPLRRETFYYTHRRGGAQRLPFDVRTEVERVLPTATSADYAFLANHDYELGAGTKAALADVAALEIRALPKGSWFFPREPVFSLSGPSALVSWLEPLLLQLHYRIQIATLAATDPTALALAVATVTCEAQRDLVAQTLEAIGSRTPPMRVEPEAYRARVRAQALELVEVVGDAGRLFEVGLRSATCVPQHLLALTGCQQAGIQRTSHVYGAQQLGMIPVGTMGHEHVQRYGADAPAFRAMRERRPQRSSYLLDTYDTFASGIPAAYALMAETPDRVDSIRYDSGDKVAQYRHAIELAKLRGLRPVQIIEDSCDAAMTRTFEALRLEVGWRPEEQFYGYGGHLVASTAGSALTRDRVAAVYKLSQTGPTATMKFGNEAGTGKQSLPGRPILFRRDTGGGPLGLIGQEGEAPPAGYRLLTGADVDPDSIDRAPPTEAASLGYTAATQALIDQLTRARIA